MICDFYKDKQSCFSCPYPDCIASDTNGLHRKRKRKHSGHGKTVFQYELDGKYIKSYGSIAAATESFGGKSCSNITSCASGKTKTAYDYKWSFDWKGDTQDATL